MNRKNRQQSYFSKKHRIFLVNVQNYDYFLQVAKMTQFE